MSICDLCQAIDPTVTQCSLQSHLRVRQQRIVAAAEHASAVPTIGAFVPGYLLVVPTTHVLSLGLLVDTELRAVEKLTDQLTDELQRLYEQPVLAFEYGLNVPDGRRVCHGHLHLVPTQARLTDWLGKQLAGYSISAFTQLPRTRETSYIVVRERERTTTCFPVPNDAFPRIRLREEVARLDPRVRDQAWDWQTSAFPELMRATVDDLTASRLRPSAVGAVGRAPGQRSSRYEGASPTGRP